MPENKRQCGSCSLCCKLTPVEEIQKAAGHRCAHQRHSDKGCCAIYETRPVSCRIWSCRWLNDPLGTKDLSRPDRTHYVLDIMPDTITVIFQDGEKIEHGVMQVWCDPKYPDAHRDPALRAMANANGIIMLVRYDSERGRVVFPPSRSQDHLWHETEVNECDTTRLSPFRRALMQMERGEENEQTALIKQALSEL